MPQFKSPFQSILNHKDHKKKQCDMNNLVYKKNNSMFIWQTNALYIQMCKCVNKKKLDKFVS